jgi:geranyl-CoA carboxylase alpha subunit
VSRFRSILIANRGEIAVRIARSAKDLGYKTIAVYSAADADALHVRSADRAVAIGPAPVSESYLNIGRIIDAAQRSGAEAVHPGYGFLSENAAFAEACAKAGLVFIGPPAEAIALMGNKAAAKKRMQEAEVPCVPGYEGEDQSDKTLTKEADRIGYPVMVKAAAGGGGRGMRVVESADAIADGLAAARSEALNAFGSDELILEKAISGARHVEIQVLADGHGNVIHLGERDCSVQRRHQKVIEEAPSPAVNEELRARMGSDAVAAARAIGYVGAGTVEFLLDAQGHYYFLEMNTRLQVEHPVTELITGLDLVAWQLRVAAGERVPFTQTDITFTGHAMEARLYAEDTAAGFLPQSGRVAAWVPPSGDGVRVDHGLLAGQDITPFYDPMVAKVITYGRDREEARRRLERALEETVLLGVASNRRFLIDVLEHESFVEGKATTNFIAETFSTDDLAEPAPTPRMLALAAVLMFRHSTSAPGWRSTGEAHWPMRLGHGDTLSDMTLTCTGPDRYSIAAGEDTIDLTILEQRDNGIRFLSADIRGTASYAFHDDVLYLDADGLTAAFNDRLLSGPETADGLGSGQFTAPMNGRVIAVEVEAGEVVEKGRRLAVLEAMKMEHQIVADVAGTVEQVAIKVGDQVAARDLLVSLAPEE